jgi:hypothetical protein
MPGRLVFFAKRPGPPVLPEPTAVDCDTFYRQDPDNSNHTQPETSDE